MHTYHIHHVHAHRRMPFHNVLSNPGFWKTFFTGNQYSYDDIPDLTGKVAIVTGATGGLGYATVVALAAHGAHVFLACRNRVKAEEAIERARADILQLQFDHPNAKHTMRFDFDAEDEKQQHQQHQYPKLEFLELELSEMRRAHAAAKEFLDRGLPLHILVNNAGIMNRDFELSEDGFENHFAINHLGHFVFTTTLLERIRESAPARIVVLSSLVHELPPSSKPIDFKSLKASTAQRNNLARYGQSKLATMLFAKALARRLRNDRVWVNIVHPGCTDTYVKKTLLAKSDSAFMRSIGPLWLKTSYPVKEAALTQLYCATSEEVEEKNIRGRYFIPIANELRPNPISDSVDLQEELWAYSEKAARGSNKV
ncbi:hypothetical protein BGZ51_004518 [Haplosporangium sp. Z 767]|nr:hypothetical protein BGZ51_004518 [Haplosporangium sp. Z 767]KAF9183083.1 hypothetical protein BGZ50_004455 [Haplosporangium sp. Z 11]